jgi:hypothetical protein
MMNPSPMRGAIIEPSVVTLGNVEDKGRALEGRQRRRLCDRATYVWIHWLFGLVQKPALVALGFLSPDFLDNL